MERKGARRPRVLDLLEEEGGLIPGAVSRVAAATGVPAADIYGVASFYSLLAKPAVEARVCQGLSCALVGAEALAAELVEAGLEVEKVSCLGQCDRAPVAIDKALELDRAGPPGAVSEASDALAINLAGVDVQDYLALSDSRSLGTEGVLGLLEASGLQGRGGAGFPAAVKWRSVAGQTDTTRYVVVNADEGEPGTFKDREVMLRRPHLLLEGLAIAAELVSATRCYIYVRGEFRASIRSLERALSEAGEALSGLDIEVVRGHGAYICGEETALLEAIEGKRGMPRLKPPYPTEVGLFGRPTLINNVETLACVPAIVRRGGEWFKALGRTGAGTKLYCISGHVARPGVYELPLGVCLDELVEVAGGYVGTPKSFSPGGASSGFLPMRYRGEALDFKNLARLDSMLGSAGVVVLNDRVSMLEATRAQQIFFEDESCGQCAPCRIGARIQRRAVESFATSGDRRGLAQVDDVHWEMKEGSICGLGMVASLPLQSALRYFPEDFEASEGGGS